MSLPKKRQKQKEREQEAHSLRERRDSDYAQLCTQVRHFFRGVNDEFSRQKRKESADAEI